jgi:hypothetical protein
MRAAVLAGLAFAAAAFGAGGVGHARAIPAAALIAAAKHAPLGLIDGLETYCDGQSEISAWLEHLTATSVRRIVWSARPCELVDRLNPNDAGGSYCVQATLDLLDPKDRRDEPEIEIYLEDPKGRRPGAVYAFRALFDGVDGPDYIRFRKDFEAEWRERFAHAPAALCSDEP